MINEKSLNLLRSEVKSRVSEKRFQHILGVEEAALEIGKFCLPSKLYELSAAALLHDVAKEIDLDEQLDILSKNGYKISAEEINAPQIIHSLVAPYVVLEEFSKFAIEEILSSVEKHTLGNADMSVFDEIIFLSDYVESGRRYQSCIAVRSYLFSHLIEGEIDRNLTVLHKACIMLIDFTVAYLTEKNQYIHPRMLKAKKAISSLL